MLKIKLATTQWEPLIEKLSTLLESNSPLTPIAAVTGQVKGFRSFKNALFGIRIVQSVGGQVIYRGPQEYEKAINTIINSQYDLIATKTMEAFNNFASQLRAGDLEQALYTAWRIKRKYRLELEWAVLKDGRYLASSKRREYSLARAIAQNKIRLFGRYLQDKDVYRLSKSFGQDLILVSYFWFVDELPKQPLPMLMRELRTTFPTVDYRLRDVGGALIWEAYDSLTGETLRKIPVKKPKKLLTNKNCIPLSKLTRLSVREDFYSILKNSTYYTPRETIQTAINKFVKKLSELPVIVYYELIPPHPGRNLVLAKTEEGKWYLAAEIPLKPNLKPDTKLVVLPVEIAQASRDSVTLYIKLPNQANGGHSFKVAAPISRKELEKIQLLGI